MQQVSIEHVSEGAVAVDTETTGKISFNEDRLTPVLTPYAGRVVELLASKGMSVIKGQPLSKRPVNPCRLFLFPADPNTTNTSLQLSKPTWAVES
jgi:hypothetical protein